MVSDETTGTGLTPEQFREVQQFFEHLRSPQQQRLRRLMEQVRPTWPDLAVTLQQLRELAIEAIAGEARDDSLSAAAAYPLQWVQVRVGSPAAAEAAANEHPTINPHNDRVLAALSLQLAATFDHLTALSVLLERQAPMRGALAAARAVLVAAARTIWLADPEIDARLRVTRAANLDLDHIKESRSDVRDDNTTTGQSSRVDLDREEDELLLAGARDGLTRSRKRFEPSENRDETLVEYVAAGLGRTAWRALSSSAHGMDRGPYAGLALQVFAASDDAFRRAQVTESIYHSVFFAHLAFIKAGSYLGSDISILEMVLGRVNELWLRGGNSGAGIQLNRQVIRGLFGV